VISEPSAPTLVMFNAVAIINLTELNQSHHTSLSVSGVNV